MLGLSYALRDGDDILTPLGAAQVTADHLIIGNVATGFADMGDSPSEQNIKDAEKLVKRFFEV